MSDLPTRHSDTKKEEIPFDNFDDEGDSLGRARSPKDETRYGDLGKRDLRGQNLESVYGPTSAPNQSDYWRKRK